MILLFALIGGAAASCRRRGWSTRRPAAPSPWAACSPSCTGPTKDLSIDFHPESRYFVQSIEYRAEVVPWFERYLYAPVIARVKLLALRTRPVQSGSAHAYLTYLVIALLGLLAMLLVQSL